MLGNRYLGRQIKSDAIDSGKLAFLSGPRQVGKTTLAKSLLVSAQNVTKAGYDREYRASGLRVVSYERFLSGLV